MLFVSPETMLRKPYIWRGGEGSSISFCHANYSSLLSWTPAPPVSIDPRSGMLGVVFSCYSVRPASCWNSTSYQYGLMLVVTIIQNGVYNMFHGTLEKSPLKSSVIFFWWKALFRRTFIMRDFGVVAIGGVVIPRNMTSFNLETLHVAWRNNLSSIWAKTAQQ